MKNLKIGAKIKLGFALSIALMIASTVATIVSSLTTLENLNIIDTGSTFQTMGSDLTNAFFDARLQVRIIMLEINDEAYQGAISSLTQCNEIIKDMNSYISKNPILEKYRSELNEVNDKMTEFHKNVEGIQNSNTALGVMVEDIQALGNSLSTLSDSLDNKNIETLRQDVSIELTASEEYQHLDDLLNGAMISGSIWVMRNQADDMIMSGPEYSNYDAVIRSVDNALALADYYDSSSSQVAEIRQELLKFRSDIEAYRDEMADNFKMIENTMTQGGAMLTALNDVMDSVNNAMGIRIETTTSVAAMFLIIVMTVAITSIVISIIMALLISRSITKPVNKLKAALNQVADGNLDVEAESNSSDEIGELTRSTRKVIDTILLLIQELSTMAGEFEKGDLDARIDISRFRGSYSEVAEGVNGMVGSVIHEILACMDCMKEYGSGNFNAEIPMLPGKKAIMNENLNTLRNNMKSISGEIGFLVDDAIKGKLSSRADANKYKGDWAGLLNGLNRLMEAIAAPINEAEKVLRQVSVGNFDKKIEGNYQGDFLVIKSSINNTVINVASYINEMSSVLGAMSQDDLGQEITREYVGKFSDMKNAINNIINKLNSIISEIYSAAEQVAAGARLISESSMTLAQGASEQASAVEELNATAITISENTTQNVESAKEAVDLSTVSKDNAQNGNQNMKDMLASMDRINESSQNIAKIIKVIDDIAFQTNLLALNAAVEAARAGQHGKGFSVVAEEVRNLAVKSQAAAKEITELVGESIDSVHEGTRVADTAASALHTIVEDVTKVSGIIDSIADASQQQAEAIGMVTTGLLQITEVVQNNSATSEGTASASQQLSSQAEILKSLISVFKLKRL